jgi:hypothetical protein
MPFKTFVSGEILTASDVNSEIMGQQICVFASAAARNAAITSPVEGQFAFLKDVDKLTFYDSTTWQEFN